MDIMWQRLPRDVVHLILKFDGRIVYRKGQYLNRIPSADPRYDMLLTQRPLPFLKPRDDDDDIIDIRVQFISKPDTRFQVSIHSMYDEDKIYQWITYHYISPYTLLSLDHTTILW